MPLYRALSHAPIDWNLVAITASLWVVMRLA
jgi:hypothetical protein